MPVYDEGITKELREFMCGCLTSEKTWQWIVEYLERKSGELGPEGTAYVNDDELNGAEIFMTGILDHLGFTEHGISIRGAWITDKGRELVRHITEKKINENDYFIL